MFSEIFSNKVQQLKNPPTIRLPCHPHIDRDQALVIANRLKTITLRGLVKRWHVLYTGLERETDEIYKQDREMIKQELPANITKWAVRLCIDKMKLYQNNISFNEIKESLLKRFDVHILHVMDEIDEPVARVHFANTITFANRHQLQTILDEILDYGVRGIEGIQTASVISIPAHKLKEDGSIEETTR